MLPDELQRLNVTHPLVIADTTIAKLPQVSDLLRALKHSFPRVQVFDGCMPEPPIEIAIEAIAFGKRTAAIAAVVELTQTVGIRARLSELGCESASSNGTGFGQYSRNGVLRLNRVLDPMADLVNATVLERD